MGFRNIFAHKYTTKKSVSNYFAVFFYKFVIKVVLLCHIIYISMVRNQSRRRPWIRFWLSAHNITTWRPLGNFGPRHIPS